MARLVVSYWSFLLLVALSGCTSAPAPAVQRPTPIASAAPPTPSVRPTLAATAAPTATSRPTPSPTPEPLGTLERIRARGRLACGMPDEDAPGLSEASEEGRFNGLAADICRALAAAALGDADAVVFEPVGAARARAALADGTVDLLSLTPVATDTETLTPTVAYARPLFFDGLGLLAPLGVEAASIRELRGVAICVEGGSDEERALAASFLAAGERLTTVVYHSAAAALAGYDEEESCTALAGRRGELAGIRRSLIVPEGSAVLDLALTREPWAPALPPDDPQWAELVELVLGGLIEAERLAIDAATVASGTEDATVRELFFRNQQARQLGLDTDALAQVIAAVGNYGEIYARNLGPETAASLPRSANGVVVENDGP